MSLMRYEKEKKKAFQQSDAQDFKYKLIIHSI